MKKQKFVFVVRTSEDGITSDAYTNVSILYKYLVSLNYGIKYIGYYEEDEDYAKFTYANLLKHINKNKTSYNICYITCTDDANIQIMKLPITSK